MSVPVWERCVFNGIEKTRKIRTRQLKQSRQIIASIFYAVRKKRPQRCSLNTMRSQHMRRVRTIDKINLLQLNTWGNLRAKHKFVVFFICHILCVSVYFFAAFGYLFVWMLLFLCISSVLYVSLVVSSANKHCNEKGAHTHTPNGNLAIDTSNVVCYKC